MAGVTALLEKARMAKKKTATKKKASKKQAEMFVDDLVEKAKKQGDTKRTNPYQEKPDETKKSKDKETVCVEVPCAHCKRLNTIRVFKEITKKAVSAEYRLYGIAEPGGQGTLDLGLEDLPDPHATAEKAEPEADAPKPKPRKRGRKPRKMKDVSALA